MKELTEEMKDLIIDFQSLSLSAVIENGKATYYTQYNDECPTCFTTLICSVRQTLRSIGHKLINIKCIYDDFKLVQIEFYTDITEEQHEVYRNIWNEYAHNKIEEQHI